MPIEQIEVQEGQVLLRIPVIAEDEQLILESFADGIAIEYVLDEDGKPTTEEKYTLRERALQAHARIVNKKMAKYQKKMALQGVEIRTI